MCTCLQQTAPPSQPKELPFPCTADNKKMKAWLLNKYASSTFTCPYRTVPCMDSPPVEIHVYPNANLRVTIPLHWQQKVHDDLLRDKSLGVIGLSAILGTSHMVRPHGGHQEARQLSPQNLRPLPSQQVLQA